MTPGDRICKLCLIKSDKFKSIEENRKAALDILLPTTIAFTAIEDPVMCQNCEETLWECSDFKAICFHSYDFLVPLVNSKDAVKLDLKDIYLNKNVTNIGISEDQNVCGFCMNVVENRYSVSLDVDVIEKEDAILEKMMEQCLPQLDLSIIRNPIICVGCHRSLEKCFRFVTNCLIAEEKIKKYCESLNFSTVGQIDLSRLLHSTMSTVEASVADGDSVDVIKAEKPLCVKSENPEDSENGDVIKLEKIFCNDSDYVNDIGNKNESSISSDNQKVNHELQFASKNISACVEDNVINFVKIEKTFYGENEIKPNDGNFVKMDDQKFILNEDIEIKTDEHDFNRFEESAKKHSIMHKASSKITMFPCDFCPFVARWKSTLNNHMLKHRDPSEVTMYNCHSCPYQAKRKFHLKNHLLKHTDPSEVIACTCDSRSHQTKYEDDLGNHVLTHTASSEATMFKRDSDLFQPRWTNCLNKPSEVIMFTCEFCSYQAKYKAYLKRHLMTHTVSSQLFKCDSCHFQTRWKDNLKHHKLKHTNPSEVTMFICNICSLQTKYKVNLKKHLITHKTSSEVSMFKCETCPFQTRLKHSLKNHMLKHMNPSEVTVFKCDSCPYESKWKSTLKHHMLKHMDPSEVTMFNCDFCSYQTKYRKGLKLHLIKHETSSVMYKCDSCPFQTIWKHSLKNHMLKHMNPSEVTEFKCDSCPYRAKWKSTLEHHMLKHVDPSEATVFNCDFCSYHTKYKIHLKRHMITHPSKHV